MSRQLVRRKISSLRRGPNARSHLGDEADARALWRSYKKQPIHPFFIKLPDLIVDANRRHWGAELEGDLDFEVDCLLLEGNLTPPQIAALQMASAVHRADISAYDKAQTVRMIREANPDMTGKQIAEEFLDLDPSATTRLDSLWSCPVEVQEAAKAGLIGISGWYEISQSDVPLETLRLKLGGQPIPKKPSTKKSATVTVEKMTLHHQSGAVVKVTGDDLSLDAAVELLNDLARQMKKAAGQGLDCKTFQSVLKDMAAASS